MKFQIILFFVFVSNNILAQRITEIEKIKNQFKANESSIYIFCRGTKSKSVLIAHKFNYSDTNITHVGIGYYKNHKFIIYNVSDIVPIANTALRVDTLESFLQSEDIYFFSAWQYQTTKRKIRKLKNLLDSYTLKNIVFDASFELNNADTLYCSEFCAEVLKKFKKRNFYIPPNEYRLKNTLLEIVLKRQKLIYFPVDFFQKLNLFKIAFQTKLTQ